MSEPTRALNAPLLLGRYRPLSLIGRGGSAFVYRGRDEYLGRDVAIKVFAAGRESDLEQYRRELRLLASLTHHGVVSIIDAGIDDSSPEDPRPFLVMQLVEGQTVREFFASNPRSVRRIGEIGFEVAEALDYVHSKGLVHRDITPSNIMLETHGAATFRPRARVTDFGIAITSASPEPEGDAVAGTIAYLSPEQVRKHRLTPATDVYSLGLVLLECFTGRMAFPGNSAQSAVIRTATDPEIDASVPAPWSTLLTEMLDRNPASRPTAAQAAERMRAALR